MSMLCFKINFLICNFEHHLGKLNFLFLSLNNINITDCLFDYFCDSFDWLTSFLTKRNYCLLDQLDVSIRENQVKNLLSITEAQFELVVLSC